MRSLEDRVVNIYALGLAGALSTFSASALTLGWDISLDAAQVKNYIVYAQELGGQTTKFGAVTNHVNGMASKIIPSNTLKTNTVYKFWVTAKSNDGIESDPSNTLILTYLGTPTTNLVNGVNVNSKTNVVDLSDITAPSVTITNAVSLSDFYPSYSIYPKGSTQNPFYSSSNINLEGAVSDKNFVRELEVCGENNGYSRNFTAEGGKFSANINYNAPGEKYFGIKAKDFVGNVVTNNYKAVILSDKIDSDKDGMSDSEEIKHKRNPFNASDRSFANLKLDRYGNRELYFSAENPLKPDMKYSVFSSSDLKNWDLLDYRGINYYTNNITQKREGMFLDTRPMQSQGFYKTLDETGE